MWLTLLRLANIGMLIDWLWFNGKRVVAWVGKWDDEPVVNHIVLDPVTQSIRNERTVYTDVAQPTRDELNQTTYKPERRGRSNPLTLSAAQTIYYDRMSWGGAVPMVQVPNDVTGTPDLMTTDQFQKLCDATERKKLELMLQRQEDEKKTNDPWDNGLYHRRL